MNLNRLQFIWCLCFYLNFFYLADAISDDKNREQLNRLQRQCIEETCGLISEVPSYSDYAHQLDERHKRDFDEKYQPLFKTWMEYELQLAVYKLDQYKEFISNNDTSNINRYSLYEFEDETLLKYFKIAGIIYLIIDNAIDLEKIRELGQLDQYISGEINVDSIFNENKARPSSSGRGTILKFFNKWNRWNK